MDLASERVCYVHCNFCNTILAVSVPCSNLFNIVTVRCGHCANLLSVNMGASLQPLPPPHPTQKQQITSSTCFGEYHSNYNKDVVDRGSSSASKCEFRSTDLQQEAPKMPSPRPPEKRQRVPSAYNRFIKEEIQRIKTSNPDISHREAFSAAAKNWAHFPHIHSGLKMDGKVDQAAAVVGEGSQKSNINSFY